MFHKLIYILLPTSNYYQIKVNSYKTEGNSYIIFFFFFDNHGCVGQLTRTSTNLMGP